MKRVIKGVHIVPMGFANAFLIEGDDGLTLIDAGFPRKAFGISTPDIQRKCINWDPQLSFGDRFILADLPIPIPARCVVWRFGANASSPRCAH